MTRASNTTTWGILPNEAKEIIRRREWDKLPTLKKRLAGEKPFPIKLGLKPPRGRTALAEMDRFRRFIEAWKQFPHQDLVQWHTISFRNLADQDIPCFIILSSISDIIQFLGKTALQRSKQWEKNMLPLLQLNHDLYPALVKKLEVMEQLNFYEAELLTTLLPQLYPGMGKGLYLRALPLIGIDTKFLETHIPLIEELLDTVQQGDVRRSGGLLSWLGCKQTPANWLTIRPLCPETTKTLAGIPILHMDADSLKEYELPGANIIIVENLQSGLALPQMPDTVSVLGAGKNITWMKAQWLQGKRVGYWGDIDTWGLSILADIREMGIKVDVLMMDEQTVHLHENRMVEEPQPILAIPNSLTSEESQLFYALTNRKFNGSRLEQERLSADYIANTLFSWLAA